MFSYLRPLMNLLIKQARVVDPTSPLHGKTLDFLIHNGKIAQAENKITGKADQVIDHKNLMISPGWMDIFAHFADPGYEYKETLQSGAEAAAAGGFTDVMVIPNTRPVIDNKGQSEYIVHKSKNLPVTVHPIGAVSKNAEGRELAEMYDMQQSGAHAFSDGLNCVQSSGLLLKALQYVKAFDGVVIQVPDDKSVNPHGLMNEGVISTMLGLAGKPSMSEELIVARDIKLARYAESKLHFTGVASKKSIEYIRRAKESGREITCSVTPYHLLFSEEDIGDYNTHLKVNPPLRSPEDRAALRMAVKDGTIDCIASHHLPHETDSKIAEFENAGFGMITLESLFSMLVEAMPDIAMERWIELLSHNPRKIFLKKTLSIQKDQEANLTLFDPSINWNYDEKNRRSRSRNSPLIGREIKGKVIGIINKDRVFLNP